MCMNNRANQIPGDPPVYRTQVWLNNAFGGKAGYQRIVEDGKTGWGTINALTRALQISMGMTSTADNFGPGTVAKFKELFPEGMSQPDSLDFESDFFGIVEGALWCKGYTASSSGEITRTFNSQLMSSIRKLYRQAGLVSESAAPKVKISLNLMKALLSMDQFVCLESYGGKEEIRTIQQYLNSEYGKYVGIVPCDGLYGRDMNRALIKMLQAIEGDTVAQADGIFGNNTKNRLPILPNASAHKDAARLFSFCLTCNGYSSTDTGWSSDVEAKARVFQKKYVLNETGRADVDTWMSLLLSKGNSARAASACDCATILDDAKAKALYDKNYRYVGRYLTGTVGNDFRPKYLTTEEANSIFNAGLRIFAIYQDGDVYLERYTYDFGVSDARKAIAAAKKLGIPHREYIYFAVDYDVMDGYINGYVKRYFEGIRDVLIEYGNIYNIGIYGARNVCSKISKAGLASSSFVSDMSTGFSGNMGYPIPDNWAFDQFHEFTFSHNGVSFPLDNNAFSGTYNGFGHLTVLDDGVALTTEEERMKQAKELLYTFPFLADHIEKIGFSFGTDYHLDLGSIEIKASATQSKLFSLDGGGRVGTLKVRNGVANYDLSQTQELIDGLDISLKESIGLNKDSASLGLELVRKIQDGKLSFGTKMNEKNELVVYLVAESYMKVRESVENIKDSVSVKIEFVIKDIGEFIAVDEKSPVRVKDILIIVGAVVVVVAAIGAVILLGGFLSAVAAMIVSAIGTFITFIIGIFGKIFA